MGQYKDGKSVSTVNHMKVDISGVLNLAVDDEVITANPAQRLGKVYHKSKFKNEINSLTREELSDLLATFNQCNSKHDPMALLFALILIPQKQPAIAK